MKLQKMVKTTPPNPFNISLHSAFEKHSFYFILEQFLSEPLDDNYFSHFLTHHVPIKQYRYSGLAAVTLAFDKMTLFQTFLSEEMLSQSAQSDGTNKIKSLLNGFFQADIFIYVALFCPEQFEKLLSFQRQYFQPSLLKTNMNVLHGFFKDFGINMKKYNRDLFLYFVEQYLELTHPSRFRHITYDLENYYFVYNQTLARCLSFAPFIPTDSSFWRLFLSHNKNESISLYSAMRLVFQTDTYQRDERFHPYLSFIFRNPTLTALAFKENYSFFLQFCDVNAAIAESPESFL